MHFILKILRYRDTEVQLTVFKRIINAVWFYSGMTGRHQANYIKDIYQLWTDDCSGDCQWSQKKKL